MVSAERMHRFVFLGGLHRSGTTLLARCLGEHPAISVFSGTGVKRDEGQFLQSVYPTARVYGGPGRFGFHREMHLTERSHLVSESNRRRLFEAWAQHWDLSKPYLLEKSPPNLLKTRFLQAMFPNAYFIILVRHPVAVSLATRKWVSRRRGGMLYHLLRHWLTCHEIFEGDRPYLKRVLIVRYERFVQAPQAVLERIHNYLELEPWPTTQTVRPDVNAQYFARWNAHYRHWPLNLYVRTLVFLFERRVYAMGYSLKDLSRLSPGLWGAELEA